MTERVGGGQTPHREAPPWSLRTEADVIPSFLYTKQYWKQTYFSVPVFNNSETKQEHMDHVCSGHSSPWKIRLCPLQTAQLSRLTAYHEPLEDAGLAEPTNPKLRRHKLFQAQPFPPLQGGPSNHPLQARDSGKCPALTPPRETAELALLQLVRSTEPFKLSRCSWWSLSCGRAAEALIFNHCRGSYL